MRYVDRPGFDAPNTDEARRALIQSRRREAALDDRSDLISADLSQTQSDLSQTQGNLSQTQGDVSQLQADLAQAQADLAQLQADLDQARADALMRDGSNTYNGDVLWLDASTPYVIGGEGAGVGGISFRSTASLERSLFVADDANDLAGTSEPYLRWQGREVTLMRSRSAGGAWSGLRDDQGGQAVFTNFPSIARRVVDYGSYTWVASTNTTGYGPILDYNANFSSAPILVGTCRYATAGSNLGLTVQIITNTTSQFRFRHYKTDGYNAGTGGVDCDVHWIAMGFQNV